MAKKSKIGVEEKVIAVKQYLQGENSSYAIAKSLGVDSTAVLDWTRKYQSEGLPGLMDTDYHKEYSPEEKQEAVEDYLTGSESLRGICKKYNIRATSTLRNWIRVYNTHGNFCAPRNVRGGKNVRVAKKTTLEERVRIAKECIAAGKTNIHEIAEKYQVSYNQVRSWVIRFEGMGEIGLEDRRGRRKKDQMPRTDVERLEIENRQLRHKLLLSEMEIDLLKKLDEVERRDAYHK